MILKSNGNKFMRSIWSDHHPTGSFTISEPRNPSIDVSEFHKFRQSPDSEALQLGKGRPGHRLASPGGPLINVRFTSKQHHIRALFDF